MISASENTFGVKQVNASKTGFTNLVRPLRGISKLPVKKISFQVCCLSLLVQCEFRHFFFFQETNNFERIL